MFVSVLKVVEIGSKVQKKAVNWTRIKQKSFSKGARRTSTRATKEIERWKKEKIQQSFSRARSK